MIPSVFTYDFAGRCRSLIDGLEKAAGDISDPRFGTGPLITTFAITMAMPLIIVPIERLGTYRGAAKHDRGNLPQMYERLRAELEKPFADASFRGEGTWSLLSVPGPVRNPHDWSEHLGKTGDLFDSRFCDAMDAQPALNVLNGLRCALGHGSIAYLNRHGQFAPGEEAEVIALFAKDYDNDERVVRIYSVNQDDFLDFLRSWADFLLEISHDAVDDRIDPPMLAAAE